MNCMTIYGIYTSSAALIPKEWKFDAKMLQPINSYTLTGRGGKWPFQQKQKQMSPLRNDYTYVLTFPTFSPFSWELLSFWSNLNFQIFSPFSGQNSESHVSHRGMWHISSWCYTHMPTISSPGQKTKDKKVLVWK